ncbi:DUF6544 family protein [Aliiglaciecola aliphaticivorans]
MDIISIFSGLSAVLLVTLLAIRLYDWQAERTQWTRLKSLQAERPHAYDPKMVAELPEPARRFFNYAISTGTELLSVAEIDISGQFSLGNKQQPNYQTMHAHQILASPYGFVWKMKLGGIVPISGSDSGKWTRFRIFGLLPVARINDNFDHRLSAYGRYIAESVFWTPAAVLPGPGVSWEAIDANSAQVTVCHGYLSQSVKIKVDAYGQLVEVSFLRWSNANDNKKYQIQPFGGRLSDFREVQGYHLPFYVEGGICSELMTISLFTKQK